MQVIQTLESVKIHTDNDKIFRQTRELLHKNFSNCLGKKSRLISFCDENELVQRRYFFKWLNCLNRRINHEDLQLEKSFYKTVHLQFLQRQSLRQFISAEVHFLDDFIKIDFSALDETLRAYLKNFFKDHELKFVQNALVLGYKNEQTLELLQRLCEQNSHLDKIISFAMDELEFLRFKSRASEGAKKSGRFMKLCSLYEAQFKTLCLPLGASAAEFKAAYKQLARKYHPDYHARASEEVKALCAERFAQINSAYECLKVLYEAHK